MKKIITASLKRRLAQLSDWEEVDMSYSKPKPTPGRFTCNNCGNTDPDLFEIHGEPIDTGRGLGFDDFNITSIECLDCGSEDVEDAEL